MLPAIKQSSQNVVTQTYCTTIPQTGTVVPSAAVHCACGNISSLGSIVSPESATISPMSRLVEEPLYVNAKQYHRILKRREQRQKLEASGKIPKERKVIRFLLELSYLI